MEICRLRKTIFLPIYKMPSKTPEGKIFNPETKRYVGKHTKRGQELLKKAESSKLESLQSEKSLLKNPTFKKVPPKINPTFKKVSPPKNPILKEASPSNNKFKKIDIIKFDLSPNNLNEKPQSKLKGKKITVDQFEELVKTDKFIEQFKDSVINLLQYKKRVYSNPEALPKNDVNVSIYKSIINKIDETLIKIGTKDNKKSNEFIRKNLLNAINNNKNGMKSLIGREDIMNNIAGMLYAFSKNYRIFTRIFLNFAFFGPAGVGKSKIASVLAYVFKKSGILVIGNVIMTTRADLVGSYVGQTAPKTRKLLFDTLEGILFIDEAYSLTPCPEKPLDKDFGGEAISELINFIDKTIGLSIIIVAGYKDLMLRCFFPFNEGLDRRFPYKFQLNNYSSENLTTMLLNILEVDNELKITPHTKNYIYSLISFLVEKYPNVLKNQAGGNMITQSIYMSYDLEWNKNERDNERIVLSAFEDFIESKNMNVFF